MRPHANLGGTRGRRVRLAVTLRPFADSYGAIREPGGPAVVPSPRTSLVAAGRFLYFTAFRSE